MKKILTILIALVFATVHLFGCDKKDDAGLAGGQVQHELTPKDIAREMQLCTVEVECGNEAGSGFIVAADEDSVVIATCYHLVDGVGAKLVRFYGETDFEASDNVSFYAYDAQFDIAFLRVSLDNSQSEYLPPQKLAATVSMGDEAFVLGNTDGLGLAFSEGVVSLVEETVTIGSEKRPVVRITTPVNGGSSGAPVFNGNNELFGMVQGRRVMSNESELQGVSYALSASIVKALYSRSLDVGVTRKIDRPTVSYSKTIATNDNVKTSYETVTIEAKDNVVTFAKKNDGLYLESFTGDLAVNVGVKLDTANGSKASTITDFTAAVLCASEEIVFTSGTVTYSVGI